MRITVRKCSNLAPWRPHHYLSLAQQCFCCCPVCCSCAFYPSESWSTANDQAFASHSYTAFIHRTVHFACSCFIAWCQRYSLLCLFWMPFTLCMLIFVHIDRHWFCYATSSLLPPPVAMKLMGQTEARTKLGSKKSLNTRYRFCLFISRPPFRFCGSFGQDSDVGWPDL